MKQPNGADGEYVEERKQTRRDIRLAEMRRAARELHAGAPIDDACPVGPGRFSRRLSSLQCIP